MTKHQDLKNDDKEPHRDIKHRGSTPVDVCVGPGESWIHWIMVCSAAMICAGQKSESLGSWCFHSCSTDVRLGTLTKDLRRRLNSFGIRSRWRILDYRWLDFVSNEWLLRETQMRFVICIVCELQRRLYGDVTRFF